MLPPIRKTMEYSRYDGSYHLDILDLKAPGMEALTRLGLHYAARESIDGSFCFQRGNYEPLHYNLLYVLTGEIRLETQEADYTIDAGSFLQLPSHISRRLQSGGARYCGLYFSSQEVNQACNLLRTDSVRIGASASLPQLANCISAFLLEKQYGTEASPTIQKANLQLMAEYLKRDFRGRFTGSVPLSLHNLEQLSARILAHPEADWSVKHLARLAGCSPSRLNSLVHGYYQCSPLQHVNRLRMEKAALLLRSNRYSLEEIAAMVGFCSVFSFSNRFFKTMGLRPSVFRRQMK